MNKKELKQYADEMDKKLNYHYYYKSSHFIKDERIASSSKLKMRLIARLKEDHDLIIEQLMERNDNQNPLNWFDIYIPDFRLSLKFCQTEQEKSEAFRKWRTYNILLFLESEETVPSIMKQIIDKLIRMQERDAKRLSRKQEKQKK